MGREEWARLRPLLDEVLELPVEKQSAFLDAHCAGEPALRAALERLIEAHEHASTILQSWDPVTGEELVQDPGTGRLAPGAVVGHFRILEFIGEGAFGEVYAAKQEGDIRRKVALKILKLGMDTRNVVARFELERQIMAMVDHTNIAEIFEAGTTSSGRPYLAMDYVDGAPITEHCDAHRLSIEERLDLFAQVCDALQHAHQKGVIHRDIKPSNILVEYEDGKATPKIIDFGVAKALNRPAVDKTVYTQAGQLVGTFAYMSPEQARLTNQDIDTRSDIYSLGVLLYELLTGLKPLDDDTLRQAALDEKLRLIRENEPARPSTKLSSGIQSVDTTACAHARQLALPALARLLRGELDWITMCALEKDRGRRYASASEFAQDVRRYLANQPVNVGPPGVGYQLAKFARRHRTGLAVACVIGAVLLVGAVATAVAMVGRYNAEERQRLAELELGRARARELVEEARLLVYQYPRRARAMLDQAAVDDPSNEDVQVQIARTEWRLGDSEAARKRLVATFERDRSNGMAAALLAGMTAQSDPQLSAQYRETAKGLVRDDALHYALGIFEAKPAAAVEHFTRALETNPWKFDALFERAIRYRDSQQWDESMNDANLARKVRPELQMVHVLHGNALLDLGDTDAAIGSLTRAISIDAGWIPYFNRGIAYARADQLELALADMEAGLELAPNEIRLHRERANIALDLDRDDVAAEAFESVVRLGDQSVFAHWDLSHALLGAGHIEEASDAYERTVEIASQEGHENLPDVMAERGHVRMLLDNLAAAEQDLRAAASSIPDDAYTQGALCHLLWRMSAYADATQHCNRAVELAPSNAYHVLKRGMAAWFVGKLPDALRDIESYARLAPNDAAWIPLWSRALHLQMDNDTAAAKSLRMAMDSDQAVIAELARYLDGRVSADDVMAKAGSAKERFLANVFLGIESVLLGDTAAAEPRLDAALGVGFPRELEFDLAQWAQRQ